MSLKRVTFVIRLPEQAALDLRRATRIYGAPSINWFVQELILSMMDPKLSRLFARRMLVNARSLADRKLKKLKEGESDGRP